MLSPALRSRSAVNIWPGFVDMLASVLLVFIFMLLIFVVAQFFLAEFANDRSRAIGQLSTNVHALLDELSLQKEQRESMRKEMDALQRQRDELQSTVTSQVATAAARERRLRAERERGTGLEAQLAREGQRAQASILERDERVRQLETRLQHQHLSLQESRLRGADATAQIVRLNEQLTDLRGRIAQLASALQIAEHTGARFKLQVDDLGKKLNLALAERVEELNRFRSDFFGRMREVLGKRDDIQISGDRFVFQSELLFASGSAELEPGGRIQLDRLARTLKSVAKKIPADVDWILRVDGHTDRRPIRTADFPSNWELSSARALSIVRYLIASGVPPRRLAAAGFGEFRPLDSGDTSAAYSRNRRIEIKVTGP